VNVGNLELLGLVNNGLEHLDSGVISGLVNLNYVHFEGNKLQNLQPDMFLGLPNIKGIFIQYPTLQTPTDRPSISLHSVIS
jgi:Leucine-rich repeat (LRR) protein